jgi:hypothetical protein
MPKKEKEGCDCGCCCGRGRFWWGVLAGIVITFVIRVLICGHGCMPGMKGCPMMGGPGAPPAQVEKK